MKNLRKQYRDLEMKVYASLRDAINNSDVYSEHISGKCIEVNVFDYTEMVILHDRLMFLDDKGYSYNLGIGDCRIEDLIDIVNNLES